MENLHSRVETWIRDQTSKVTWGPLQWRMRWPPWNWFQGDKPWNWFQGDKQKQHRKMIQLEYERRRKQLNDLCLAVKADSVSDLQDILCCMVLAECVYKRPATEMIRAVNKFRADFGGEIVSLERVQPSSDHVPHRYLLAEAGDTLFASFIGTKQYKDVVTDVNILQGVIFHEDSTDDAAQIEAIESGQGDSQKGNVEYQWNPLEPKPKQLKDQPKPAAHRGFLARAKGIPALELYRLAQKKKRKLVLCGHSLGGAVAALATLAILRVIAATSPAKESEKVQVKCITFSQPPVGNAALRDYVHEKGWQNYFKSYCIPEDLVPRILSPAYFHHYNAQPSTMQSGAETISQSMPKEKSGVEKPRENEKEQLVLGLGPVQTSFWRVSRLVPLEGFRRQIQKYTRKQVDPIERSGIRNSNAALIEDVAAEPQSLEIEEGSDGISLKPLLETNNGEAVTAKLAEKGNDKGGDRNNWRRVPYLPSYVPFGQLYLLGNSSVELLSGAEYSKLTSVRSVITELRERFQSHSMRSYRARFQRMYETCMDYGVSPLSGMEQMPQFPHLQQWLGLAVAGAVELAQIVELPVIRTATSIVPLGWNDLSGGKNGEPLKVDITGFGLHLCNLVHARVNGNWCSAKVESFPSAPSYSSSHDLQPELQKIRVLVGPPLRRPPKDPIATDSSLPVFTSVDTDTDFPNGDHGLERGKKFLFPESLSDFWVFCTSDFATVSKDVHVRTRRVRLLGLEGAGKTSLFKAIMRQGRVTTVSNFENVHVEVDVREGIAGGVCYMDSAGVNLQELNMEASRFRDELWMGIRDICRKTDLIILVHNMSHKIPRTSNPNTLQQQPVLSLLLDEAKALGIPWILALTNKFSVSAHQQKAAIDGALQAYQASLSTTEVVNSCPYVIPSTAAASASLSLAATERDSGWKIGAQSIISFPINLVRRPFQRRDTIFPVEGVNSLCQLVHRVLRSHEEASLQELARDRLVAELARESAMAIDASRNSQAKESSLTAAAVGASLGAGVGLLLAVVMGAASALRKP